ncbi:MAG: ABC transporter ATP-binding protein/permease [Firmicutes bacterium]|nr:ABC transporter ATP-binding protein/permease [Bacillota bacterium]
MLQIKNVSKKYITGELEQIALDDVSLNLRDNEFVAILGPSGSGKTTLLNVIGGLDRYDDGDLVINGVTTKAYKDRDWDSYRNHTIGFVFQSYNLIPHQTILANVELALTIGGISGEHRKARAKEALEKVGLGDQIHKKPNQLSGGQMQRVAIARALVNDPDILLADEPTGALDTDTSIQVLDLLKEVAKDRLVVMVTHNPELAEQYATRIVKLRDGKIVSDSDPFMVRDEDANHRNMGKASMSFLTALALSFNNLRTKKARTILVAFAGSIGIIGIALILSLSNGVNKYIDSIEEETLSEYPLQITSTSFDMTSLMASRSDRFDKDDEDGDAEVTELQIISDMFSSVEKNDLASLKKYLDSEGSGILNYAKAVEYSYNVSPLIYREDGSGVRRVNPDPTFESYGMGSESYTMMGMSMDIFTQIPRDENLYVSQYDIKVGRWPKAYNECVLILSGSGHISDFTLYTLGLKDASELDQMIKDFYDGKVVDVHESQSKIFDYEDFVGIEFRIVDAFKCYSYDAEYKVWTDKTDDKVYMKRLVSESEPLTIVGVVSPSEDAKVAMLSMGIGYRAELVDYVVDAALESDIVKKQLADKNIDVFSGKEFSAEEEDGGFNMESLFSIDEDAIGDMFSFDMGSISSGIDFGSSLINLPNVDVTDMIDLGALIKSLPELTESDLQVFLEILESAVDEDRMSQVAGELASGFEAYTTANGIKGEEDTRAAIGAYLSTEGARGIIEKGISEVIHAEDFTEGMSEGVQSIVDKYTEAVSSAISEMINTAIQGYMSQMESSLNGMMGQLVNNIAGAFRFDQTAMERAFQIKMTEKELQELMSSLMSTGASSYENNLKKLGYADRNEPSVVTIYPRDFESKGKIVEILDAYNSRMEAAGEEGKVIRYTDIVGTLMSSVTDIINAISYVLIAFVAISLVVSSIMIGVITYISVLERKKEIGILRAIGASKRNISSVFNAETFIIGLLAGLLGVGISAILLIPGNKLIHYLAGSNEINAVLPLSAAVVLVILSIMLTLIGGIIPSKKAAKSDPVTALRTE